MVKKRIQEDVDEELDRLVERYLDARARANKALQEAYRARRRMVSIITNPKFNQGTENRPMRRTHSYAIELIPKRRRTARPSEIIAWVRATFSSRKERVELIDALLREDVRAEGIELVERKGKNVARFWEILSVAISWRVKVEEVEEKKGE